MQQASKFVVKNDVKSMTINVFMAHMYTDNRCRGLLIFMLSLLNRRFFIIFTFALCFLTLKTHCHHDQQQAGTANGILAGQSSKF